MKKGDKKEFELKCSNIGTLNSAEGRMMAALGNDTNVNMSFPFDLADIAGVANQKFKVTVERL
jgi:hypothetical protein